jgi:hypothetical protein
VVSITPRPRLTPGERTPGTHWIGGWVGLRAGLDAGTRRKIRPCRGSNGSRFFFKFRVWAAPQFWRVNSCQKSAAYARVNTVGYTSRLKVYVALCNVVITFNYRADNERSRARCSGCIWLLFCSSAVFWLDSLHFASVAKTFQKERKLSKTYGKISTRVTNGSKFVLKHGN